MKIFAIDTSSVTCSAALYADADVLDEGFVNNGLTHSETLMPMVGTLLKDCKPESVDYFAITSGPGSFTGLRIGMAAVKGMAAVYDTPCIEISTLEALAFGVKGDGLIYAVMDARRNQVYNAIFRKTGDELVRICDDRAVSLDEIREEIKNLNETVILVGDGTDLCYNYLKDDAKFIVPSLGDDRFLHAGSVAMLARRYIDRAASAAKLVPHYLRLPQAERELRAKEKIK